MAPLDRGAAILRLCADDAALEAEVRSLVDSAARIGSFLEQPALGKGIEQLTQESAADGADELIGATLGAYRIETRLASGGMGTVYRACRSDGQYDQRVAIKVVKRGMDSEEILRRFRDERQTLAALDHPNIARLIDAGITPDSRPFIVMEYIDGKPIHDYCDDNRLRVRERLAIFLDVCQGVHHAHRNLVIHRDIKPGNILVTPEGVPKLLDFGIAKVVSGTGVHPTRTADTDRRLTPEYASPEQVEGGAITTATDVYSLGVVLYELLTGTRPYSFHLRTTEELRRVICELTPPPPSAAVTVRVTRVRAASDAVRKAAAPADANREPVRAGPAEGRSAAAPTEAASAADAPRTRGVSSTRLRSLLRGDLDTIVLMAMRKEPQRRYASAEQFGADIRRYLDGMPVQARRDTAVYRASKFVRRHALGVSFTALSLALLSAATVLLSRQADRLTRQRDELAAANARLDESRGFLADMIGGADTANLGPDARLGDALREAIARLRSRPPADRITRASIEQEIGRAGMSLGMLEDARPLLESARAGFASLHERSDPRMDIEVDLAELLYFEGRFAEAEGALRALLDVERELSRDGHTDREGRVLNDLGACQRRQGRLAEAIETQTRAIAVRAAVLGERSVAVAESRNNLASALFQENRIPEAMAEFRRSLDVRLALHRADHPLVIRCRANLGLVELRAGELQAAVRNLTEAADAWDRAFGPDHPGRVATMTSLAQALSGANRQDEALAWLTRCLDWQRAHQSDDAPALAATEANIGVTLAAAGRFDEAQGTLERVLPVLQESRPAKSGIIAAAASALADIYEREGRAGDAAALRAIVTPPR